VTLMRLVRGTHMSFKTGRIRNIALDASSAGYRDEFNLVCTPNTDSREDDTVRKLTFGMNLSLDGYIAAPGDDLGWSVPSDELFQWWSDRVGATGLALYGRKLWETMSSHWPTADQQPRRHPRPSLNLSTTS
jgi:hypothetical protein